MTRYVLHPGLIHSRNDRDIHFISAGKLRVLYHVPPDAHIIVVDDYHPEWGYHEQEGDVHLRPRYSGAYQPVGPEGER